MIEHISLAAAMAYDEEQLAGMGRHALRRFKNLKRFEGVGDHRIFNTWSTIMTVDDAYVRATQQVRELFARMGERIGFMPTAPGKAPEPFCSSTPAM